MSFTEDYHRSNATRTALEWMMIRILRLSPDPKAALADYTEHMNARIAELEAAGQKWLLEGKTDTFSNAMEAIGELELLRDELPQNINIAE